MSLIRIDYDEALAILKKIDAAAETYIGYAKTARALSDELEQAWDSPSAVSTLASLECIIQNQSKIGNKILKKSAAVRAQLNEMAAADSALADSITGAGRRG